MRKKWRIEGRVQGVGYRRNAAREATRLGLGGWVRNVADGSVELLAEGEEEALALLARWCYQGPPGARVTAVIEQAVLAEDAAPLPFAVVD
mgnify:CR=1 FL=1